MLLAFGGMRAWVPASLLQQGLQPETTQIGTAMLGKIREIVAHSSPAVREVVGFASYFIPSRLRLGSDFYSTLAQIEKARIDPNWAKEEQRRLLERVISKASQTSYYAGVGAQWSDKSDIYDVVSSFPVLTRAALTAHRDELLTVPRSQVDLVSTSGSTGKPAVFYLDKIRGAGEWAYVSDAWRSSGYRPDDWRAVFRGQKLGRKGKRQLTARSTRELFLSPFGMEASTAQDYWQVIGKKKIVFTATGIRRRWRS